MSFHVEVRRSFHRAWLFNLTEEQVLTRVVEPWAHGAVVELGDREWTAADSRLTVLEGRTLDASELALGQGWNNATKVAEDVTGRLLADALPATRPGAVAVVGDDPASVSTMASLVSDLGLDPVQWELVQARVLAGAGGEAGANAAVVILDRPPTPELALSLGLALGALPGRVVLVQAGSTPLPPELAQLGHVRMEPGGQAWIHALAERLRSAGCALQPRPGWDAPERFARA